MIRPTEQAIFKVADACNLNCSYCYYYTPAFDAGKPPKIMSLEVAREFFERVREHCDKYSLSSFGVLFHGGEPLLATSRYYERLFAIAEQALAGKVTVKWKMTTNGVLLSQRYIDLFRDRGVAVTVSLDGPKAVHDRFRVDHKNRGSFDAVARALDLLVRNELPVSVLCTIDPSGDGAETYRFFRSMNIERMNFMLPDYSHDTFPFPDLGQFNDACFEYMKRAFDVWLEEDNPAVSVLYFEELIRVVLGFPFELCTMQPSCPNFITVETGGDINHCDLMRLSGTANYRTGASVRQPLDAVDSHPVHAAMGEPDALLCDECRACQYLDACGGHCPGTRYSAAAGFDNVSIYCAFFKRFIPYVGSRVLTSVN